MSTDDRIADGDDRTIPEPDAPESDSERDKATAFADLVHGLVAREPTPPALTPDDRALLEAATMIHASTHAYALADERRSALIDRAFGDALELPAPAEEERPAAAHAQADITPLRPRRVLRAVPWAVATVAVAAAVLLFVTRPDSNASAPRVVVVERPALSDINRSRPTDELIGKIDPADSGRASERIDIIYADRMAGYRDLRLRGLAPKGGAR